MRQWLYRLAFVAVPMLPLGSVRLIAWLFGNIAWFCDPRGRRVVEHNLAPALGPCSSAALRRIARRSYINFVICIADIFNLPLVAKHIAKSDDFTLIDPWHVFDSAPLNGPLIIATPHCNWELTGAMLRGNEFLSELAVIALSHDDDGIDRLFTAARRGAGVDSLMLDQAPLASLRALNRGQILGIAADRDYTGHGVPARLFGQPIQVPVGPAALSVQSGARIVPVCAFHHGARRVSLLVGKPLQADPEQSKRVNVRVLTQLLITWFGRCIQAAPSQWSAFHPVWQHRHGDTE